MRKLKKFLAAAVTASMVSSLSLLNVAAADYTYTVTFYAGNQGSFTDLSGLDVIGNENRQISTETDQDSGICKVTVTGLNKGDQIVFESIQEAVTLKEDSKYYIQGLRLSGRDNDEKTEAPAFWVEEDADYVVAYGIQGDMTSYTVNYVDENGNELAPSRTYYGNVGDKPVVAYRYMEGYTPQALTLTRTLSANQADNVFTFEYSPNPVEVIPGETVTVTTVEPGTTNVITQQVPAAGTGVTGGAAAGGTGTGTAGATGDNAGAGAGTPGGGTAGAGAADTGTAGAGTGAGTGAGAGAGAVIGGDNQTGTGQTGEDAQAGQAEGAGQTGEETQEIQEEDTPLGQIDLDEGEEDADAEPESREEGRGSVLPIAAGIAGVAVAAIGAGCIILLRMRRK